MLFKAGDINPHENNNWAGGEASELARLNVVADNLMKRCKDIVTWYLEHKQRPRGLSQFLRSAAITFSVFGGLVPLLSPILQNMPFIQPYVNAAYLSQSGYVAIALAGAALLADRYFGFSVSWMRYMSAQMSLQRALEAFQLNWALWQVHVGTDPLSAEQRTTAINLLTGFQKQIADSVDKEFETWLSQFQEQLTALQAAIDKDKVSARPGNLMLKFSAAQAITGSKDIYVNNQKVKSVTDNSVLINDLAAGSYFVLVKAEQDKLQGCAAVTITAGNITEQTIELAS